MLTKFSNAILLFESKSLELQIELYDNDIRKDIRDKNKRISYVANYFK